MVVQCNKEIFEEEHSCIENRIEQSTKFVV